MADSEEVPEAFASLFVTNMADDEAAIRAAFSEFGTVKYLRLLPLKDGSTSRAGVIEMSSGAEARDAKERLTGKEMDGCDRKIRMIWDTRSLERFKQRNGGGGGGDSNRDRSSVFGGRSGGFGVGAGETSNGGFGRSASQPPAAASASEDGETISLNGRDLTAIKSIVAGQTTVIGYLFKDYTTPSAPGTPAVNGFVSLSPAAEQSSTAGGFGRSREAASGGSASFGRRASVREEPPAEVKESSAPEEKISVDCIQVAKPDSDGRVGAAQVTNNNQGDIMPTAYSSVRRSAAKDALGSGVVNGRMDYFSRKSTVDVGSSKSVTETTCTFPANPVTETVPVAEPEVVPVVAEVEKPKHPRIMAPTEASPEKSDSSAARLALRRRTMTPLRPGHGTAGSATFQTFLESTLIDAITKKAPAVGDTIYVGVRHVFDDCSVAVWSADAENNFPAATMAKKLSDDLGKFYATDQSKSDVGLLSENQPLAVRIKSIWYRAKFLSQPATDVSRVFLVDLGEEHQIPNCDVRLLNASFGKEPVLAVRAKVSNLPGTLTPIIREDLHSILQKPGNEVISVRVTTASPLELEFIIGEYVYTIPMLLLKKRLEREGRKSFLGSVMFAEGPSRLFMLDHEKRVELEDYQARIAEEAEILPRLPASLQPNALNTVLFEDGIYYRCVILSITNGLYNVELFDYGNPYTCKADRIWGLSLKLAEQEEITEILWLAGINADTATEPALLAEVKALEEQPVVYEVVASDDSGLSARVWNSNGDLVGEKWMGPVNLYKFLLDGLTYAKTYKVGDVISVRVSYVADPEFLYLTEGKEVEINPLLQKLCEEMDAACDGAPKLKFMPPVGAIVCGKYGDNWYRAVVNDRLSDTKVEVTYVDYGNSETLEIDGVREMTPEWMQVPKMVLHASLRGVRPKEAHVLSELESAIEAVLSKSGSFTITTLDCAGSQLIGDLTLDGIGNVADLFLAKDIAVRA